MPNQILKQDYTLANSTNIILDTDFPTTLPRVKKNYTITYTASTGDFVFNKGTIAANDFESGVILFTNSQGSVQIKENINVDTPANITTSLTSLGATSRAYLATIQLLKKGYQNAVAPFDFDPLKDFTRTVQY